MSTGIATTPSTSSRRDLPFWRTIGNKDYFDGCLRDVLQAQRAIRYTKLQAVRARVVSDHREYPHTRIYLHLDGAVRRAADIGAYLEDVPYARYERRQQRRLALARRGHG